MANNIDCDIAAMRQMTVSELRKRCLEMFGEMPRSSHKEHIIRRIIWRVQAQYEGGLSERARQRAVELAREEDLRISKPRKAKTSPTTQRRRAGSDKRLPMPGTILVRQYAAKTYQVQVLRQGFEYDGQTFKSLTAVAKQITGKHWNGYHFFGLKK